MAKRRMFSPKIINSARFLKMPPSTQALYFHLGLNADDDGVVEAFTVMRMTGATEDEIKVLHAKNLIHILNEDLVTHITDWSEHNKIRSDRKVDSVYQKLLLEIVPDAQVISPTQRADRGGTSQGLPKDDIGKVRLGKDSKEKNTKKETPKKIKPDWVDDKDAYDKFISESVSKFYNRDETLPWFEELYPSLKIFETCKRISEVLKTDTEYTRLKKAYRSSKTGVLCMTSRIQDMVTWTKCRIFKDRS